MSKLIRTVLIIAFAIFVVGGITAIIVTNHQPAKKTATKTTNEKTITTSTNNAGTTPATSSTATTPAAPAASSVPAASSAKKPIVTQHYVTTYYYEDDASASASAGVNADGSAWAFADAN